MSSVLKKADKLNLSLSLLIRERPGEIGHSPTVRMGMVPVGSCSSAQYWIVSQTVTSSKGSFKLNPAKSRRAARASLLDLGDSEMTDRVSWLDQRSLTDTMAFTARIAQGLKEDEPV